MDSPSAVERPLCRFPQRSSGHDFLAVEEPLEIRIDSAPLAVTMRTPGHDTELAAGFCLTEGVIDSPDDLERVEPCALANYGNVVVITLARSALLSRERQITEARREFYVSSSCGLCGSQTIDRVQKQVKPLTCSFTVLPAVLVQLPARMFEVQETFSRTGGLHAAALFDAQGQLHLLREDVGRHNAVDKVIGAMLLSGQLPAGHRILLVSGRASFELVQKAARAGIGFLAAIGAPSSLAVDAAAQFGMTLVGFLRSDGRFNVYHDSGRIGTW